jgi:uncharacterized protein (DUF736 family)
MTIIGDFMPMGQRFVGNIQTATLAADARLIPVADAGAGAPDYRLMTNHGVIGTAWRRVDPATQHAYLAVRFTDPALTEPVQARLVQQDALTYLLLLSTNNA